MFARLLPPEKGVPDRLTTKTLVTPSTLAEALYDILFYHMAVRLAPGLDIITHSATVNHGGGLRKEKERVYANPCHHAQTLFAAFAGARPCRHTLVCGSEKNPGLLVHAPQKEPIPVLDVLTAIDRSGDLLISIVHRGTAGPVKLEITMAGQQCNSPAGMWLLTAPLPWAANFARKPNAIVPKYIQLKVAGKRVTVTMPRFSVALARAAVSGM